MKHSDATLKQSAVLSNCNTFNAVGNSAYSATRPTKVHSEMLQHGAKGLEMLMNQYADLKSNPVSQPRYPVVPRVPFANVSAQPQNAAAGMHVQSSYGLSVRNGCAVSSGSLNSAYSFGMGLTMAPFPSWVNDSTRVPKLYHNYLKSCCAHGAQSGYPDTSMVYKLLIGSGLSRELLGYIWSLANRTMPGQLTIHEFYVVLALVALAQKYTGVLPSIEGLQKETDIPLPQFPLSTTANDILPSNLLQHMGSEATASTAFPSSQAPIKTSVVLPPITSVTASALFPAEDSNFADFERNFDSTAKTDQTSLQLSADIQDSDKDKYNALRDLVVPGLASDSVANLPVPSVTALVLEPPMGYATNEFAELQSTVALPRQNQILNAPLQPSNAAFVVHKPVVLDPEAVISQQISSISSNNWNLAGNGLRVSSNPASSVQTPGTSRPHSPSSGSVHSLSHESSLHSLELKPGGIGNSASEENITMAGANTVATATSEPEKLPDWIFDRYAAVRGLEEQLSNNTFSERNTHDQTTEQHLRAWAKCLEVSLKIVSEARKLLGEASCSSVCREFVATERGANFIKSIGEIYRVVCRIKLSLKTTAFQTEQVVALLSDIRIQYEDFAALVGFCKLLPSDAALELRDVIISTTNPESEKVSRSCGLCLLNVDSGRVNDSHNNATYVEFGGKFYHPQCANLWINCVDPLLPALQVPTLL